MARSRCAPPASSYEPWPRYTTRCRNYRRESRSEYSPHRRPTGGGSACAWRLFLLAFSARCGRVRDQHGPEASRSLPQRHAHRWLAPGGPTSVQLGCNSGQQAQFVVLANTGAEDVQWQVVYSVSADQAAVTISPRQGNVRAGTSMVIQSRANVDLTASRGSFTLIPIHQRLARLPVSVTQLLVASEPTPHGIRSRRPITTASLRVLGKMWA